MIAALLSTFVHVVMPLPARTLQLSDAARVYAHQRELDGDTTLDLENAPRVATGLVWPTLDLELAYAPRLTWVDVLGPEPSPTLLLHSAALQLSWRQPRYTLSIAQTGALGSRDFSEAGATALSSFETTAASPDGPTGAELELTLLPSPRYVRIAEEETSVTLRYFWSRRLSSAFDGAFGFSGGANAQAQRFVPRQRRAELAASLDVRQSPRDVLTTRLAGAQIETSNGYSHWLTTTMESWSHSFSANSGSEIGLGVAAQDTTAPDGSQSTMWTPVSSATLAHAVLMRDVQARFLWSLGYGPDVNLILGTLQNRLSATSRATLTFDRTSLSFGLGAAQTLPADDPDSASVVNADVAFDRELLDWLSLQLGGSITWQGFSSSSALASPTSVWRLYAGLEGRTPKLRF